MPHPFAVLTSPSTAPRRGAPALLLALLVALAMLGACKPSPQQVEAEKGEIRQTLGTYARQLSHAYAFADPSALAEVAMPREVASVENNIARMANDGRRIAADQKELTIEDLDVFQVGDAYVRTFEVWDIRVFAVGSEQEISRDENQESRVRYRLKKDDEGQWKVLWRQRLDDKGGMRSGAGRYREGSSGEGSGGGDAGGSGQGGASAP